MLSRLLLASLAGLLLAAPSAHAFPNLPAVPTPLSGNPADRLLAKPIEDPAYDRATRCTPRAGRPGTKALAAWLGRNFAGAFWGDYRCEIWSRRPREASLHAEKRAIDWHLDARVPAQRREAERIIRYLLAPDAAGNLTALARRLGVQEIIWDCGYWGAGMLEFKRYGPCVTTSGKWRKKVNFTVAHRDHLHIGLTRAGAMGRTSFWR